MIRTIGALSFALLLSAFIAFASSAGAAEEDPASEIRTLLPKDAIPAIDDPRFVSTRAAEKFMSPGEMVIGVDFAGDRRAYSVPLLSSHEIVNDVVGGRKIAVTW